MSMADEANSFITKITLERFKKFKSISLDLKPFTLIMGENSSGKTSVLQALNLALTSLKAFDFIKIKDDNTVVVRPKGVGLTQVPGIQLSDFRELFYAKRFAPGKGRYDGLMIEVEDASSNCYRLKITSLFGAFNMKCVSSESDLAYHPTLQLKAPLFISGFVGLSANEERTYPVALQTRLQYGQVSSILRNLLLELKLRNMPKYSALAARMKSDFDFHLDELLFNDESDLHVTAHFADKCGDTRVSLDLSASGSGFLQILQILVPIYMYCPQRCNVVLLDEPDAHLHTNLQATLASTLQHIQKELGIQIILSTHSTAIIRSVNPSSIIPISPSSKHCAPLATEGQVEEHIKEKIDNYNLAKSVISGKLIFFEDNDISVYTEIDSLIGVKSLSGSATVPTIRGRGKDDKGPYVLKELMRELSKDDIEIHVVRDSDGLSQQWIEDIVQHGADANITVHVLGRYEIENYVIHPEFIERAIRSKYPGKKDGDFPSREDIEAKVVEALKNTVTMNRFGYDNTLEDCIFKTAILLKRDEYRKLDTAKSEAKKIREVNEEADSIEQLLVVGMGKEALRVVFAWLNDNWKLNLNKKDLLSVLMREDIPEELVAIFESFRSKEAKVELATLELVEGDAVDVPERDRQGSLFLGAESGVP